MSQTEKSAIVEGPMQNRRAKSWTVCSTIYLKQINKQTHTHTQLKNSVTSVWGGGVGLKAHQVLW